MPLARKAGKAGQPQGQPRPDIRKPGDLPARERHEVRAGCPGVGHLRMRPPFLPRSDVMPRTDAMSDATATNLPDAELLICVTCKTSLPANPLADLAAAEDETRPGARLYAALMAGELPAGLQVHAVECLSNCTRGCTVALRGGDARWSYVYGNLNPDTDVETLRDGAARYLTAADGLVPWRERSQHFRKNCIARIPPATFTPIDLTPATLTKDAPNV